MPELRHLKRPQRAVLQHLRHFPHRRADEHRNTGYNTQQNPNNANNPNGYNNYNNPYGSYPPPQTAQTIRAAALAACRSRSTPWAAQSRGIVADNVTYGDVSKVVQHDIDDYYLSRVPQY